MAYVQTFKNLQDRVLRQLDEAGDTDTTLALVKDALNDANRKRCGEEAWSFMLWDGAETLSIVSGTQSYALHPEYFRPFYFYNRTQQDFMVEVKEASLVQSHADWLNPVSGALKFSLWGRLEVAAQPAAASLLTLASSSATDSGSATITVKGDTATGVRSETITCGSSGLVPFTKVLKVTKIGTWLGTLTLTAGATTLLTLFANEAGRSYQRLFIQGIPDAAETVEYRFYRQPSVMSVDEDRPDVPTPYEDILVYDALLMFAAYNQYDATTVKIWMRKQEELLQSLEAAYSDAQALEAQTHYTTYIPR